MANRKVWFVVLFSVLVSVAAMGDHASMPATAVGSMPEMTSATPPAAVPVTVAASGVPETGSPVPTSTKDDLLTAFQGEANAAARYEAFAKKADEEGYAGAASLFRAAAVSEKVHCANHAKVLATLGVTPTPEIKAIEVKSTKENVAAALAGETYERDVMYPGFIAKAGDNLAAATSFKQALAAETEHAVYFANAVKKIDSWKTKTDFLVCPTCGFTTMDVTLKLCPVCALAGEKLTKVN